MDLNRRIGELEDLAPITEAVQLGGGRVDFALVMGAVGLGVVIAQQAPSVLLLLFCAAGFAWSFSDRARLAAKAWFETVYRALREEASAENEGAGGIDFREAHLTGNARRRIRICIVDDVDSICENLTKLASFEPDFEIVGTAGDGEMAVELVRRERPDVVLMDVIMPVMNGFSAAEAIKAEAAATKVILMSVVGSDDYRRRAADAGAHAFISKSPPFTWDEAANLIRRVAWRAWTNHSEENHGLGLAVARIKRERHAVEVSLRDFALMEKNQANRLN